MWGDWGSARLGSGWAPVAEVAAPGVPILQGGGGAVGDQEWGSLKCACDQGPPGMCPRKSTGK